MHGPQAPVTAIKDDNNVHRGGEEKPLHHSPLPPSHKCVYPTPYLSPSSPPGSIAVTIAVFRPMPRRVDCYTSIKRIGAMVVNIQRAAGTAVSLEDFFGA